MVGRLVEFPATTFVDTWGRTEGLRPTEMDKPVMAMILVYLDKYRVPANAISRKTKVRAEPT